jgi:hypothetical protein
MARPTRHREARSAVAIQNQTSRFRNGGKLTPARPTPSCRTWSGIHDFSLA